MWTAETGLQSLGLMNDDSFFPSARVRVFDDGSVIAGTTQSPVTEAFIYYMDQLAWITKIGRFSRCQFLSSAAGISADGSTVIGLSNSDAGQVAFRWTLETGMQELGAA